MGIESGGVRRSPFFGNFALKMPAKMKLAGS